MNIKVESPKEIIDALELLNDIECIQDESFIETSHATFSFDENEAVLVKFTTGDLETVPVDEFEKWWKESFDGEDVRMNMVEPDYITMLGDNDSWMGGVGAALFNVDERVQEALNNGGFPPGDLGNVRLLSHAQSTLRSNGGLGDADMDVVLGLARRALADADLHVVAEGFGVSGKDMCRIQSVLVDIAPSFDEVDDELEPGM